MAAPLGASSALSASLLLAGSREEEMKEITCFTLKLRRRGYLPPVFYEEWAGWKPVMAFLQTTTIEDMGETAEAS